MKNCGLTLLTKTNCVLGENVFTHEKLKTDVNYPSNMKMSP